MTRNGFGFSVQTAPGLTIDELALGGMFPNSRISWTTVAMMQAISGVVVIFPTPGRGAFYGTVIVPNPPPHGLFDQLSALFRQKQIHFPQNPNCYRICAGDQHDRGINRLQCHDG